MHLLGLEISDAGIMAATKDPVALLQLDGVELESPGFAFAEKRQLRVGRAAESNAHLKPTQAVNHFWDLLSAEPLKRPFPQAHNLAEIACTHLAQIWEGIKGHGDELAIAVPGYFTRDQLGLILGIAEELAVPLKGIVSLPVIVATRSCPERLLLHLDMHLHRLEMTYLEQTGHLTQKDTVTASGKGLLHLYGEWVKVIADEFVRATRFDPFHQAVYEQTLYDRLPGLLAELQQQPSLKFEMTAGSKTYRVTLPRDRFVAKSETVFWEMRRLIARMWKKHGKTGQAITLQVTHRVTRLPGFKEMLAGMPDTQIIALEPGAGALGAARLWNQLDAHGNGPSVSFLISRPWGAPQPSPPVRDRAQWAISQKNVRPTHLLYRDLAYPISSQPLVVGRGDTTDGVGVRIEGEPGGVSMKHFTIQRRGEDVVLTDHSTYGTFIDTTQVSGSAILQLGQIIRLGTPGEELQLIACVETDEA